MPVQVNIVSQKYKREYVNGTSFNDNPSDFTQNLVGSVMEKVRVNIHFAVSWAFWSTSNDGSEAGLKMVVFWDFTNDNLLIQRKDGGDFNEDGLYPGQNVALRAGDDYYYDKTILSVNKDSIVIDMDGVTQWPNAIANLGVFGDEPLTALVQNFGIIENKETFNTESKVSENNQGYYGVDIGVNEGSERSTSFVDMTRLGKYKDWISGSAKVKYVKQDVGIYNTGPLQTAQVFEIQHDFIINPWYLQGGMSNLENNVIPDDLIGINSYKYVFDCSFREVISNPNSAIDVTIENVLGSVAWFGESFNGFQNNYEIESITYKDAASNVVDGILVSGETHLKIIVSKITGSFNSGDTTGVYISYLPNQTQYTDTIASNLIDNFMYDRAIVAEGAAAAAGSDFISSIESNIVAGNMEIDVVLEYSTSQSATLAQALLDGNGKFLIAVQTGDKTLTGGNSDSVLNYVLGDYDKSPDIDGLISLDNFGIYPLVGDPNTIGSYSTLETWIEDGILAEFKIGLDLSKKAILNSLQILCLAYNPTTKQYFTLDNFSLNLNPIERNGIQEIEVADNRGYILGNADLYNTATVTTGNKVGNIQSYEGIFGQKIPWQSWIKEFGVDTIFYDKSEPQNGLNLKADRYSGFEGYQIHLGLLASVDGVSDLGISASTNYLLLSSAIQVDDYGKDNGVVSAWTGVIKTINPSNDTNLNQGLLDGEDTLIQVTWTSSGGSIMDITNFFAAIRVEETEQPGYALTEISNVRDAKEGQLLYGNVTPLRLNLYISSGKVIAEAMFRGANKITGKSYNISAAIRESETPSIVGGFDYENWFQIN